MSYSLWVALGILAAFLASRGQPADRPELAPHRQALFTAAMIGAVLGAFLFELPADLAGWAWVPPDAPKDLLPLGGRTVLGGLLGGWLTVEAVKWRRGIRDPTGDRFALPLALALAFGRLGCTSAGCCAGQTCVTETWWTWHGRIPVQPMEVAFHAGCALALWWAARRGWATGRRLAIYLTVYGVVRFALEFARENPPIALGLTWYQFLALALVVLAGGTWFHRSYSMAHVRSSKDTSTGSCDPHREESVRGTSAHADRPFE